jgi:hypothetical protein
MASADVSACLEGLDPDEAAQHQGGKHCHFEKSGLHGTISCCRENARIVPRFRRIWPMREKNAKTRNGAERAPSCGGMSFVYLR